MAAEVVRAFNEACLRGDWAALESLIDPDLEIHEAPSMPYGGTFRGLEGLRQLMGLARAVWTDLGGDNRQPYKVFDLESTDDGDLVLMLGKLDSRVGGGDTRMQMTIAEIHRVVDGRIVELTPHYWDTAAIAAAFAAASQHNRSTVE